MRNLYFAFAVLALPLTAFAEVSDTMINQTSLKQAPIESCPKDQLSCADTTPKSEKIKRKERFEENKNSINNRNGQVASRKRQPVEPNLK